jgi:methylamine---glutamate N-methyltransferase subunit A
MCGIAALQLHDRELSPRLGLLMQGMLREIVDRGSDSAGIAVYGSNVLTPSGTTTVTLLELSIPPSQLLGALSAALPSSADVQVTDYGETTLVSAAVSTATLEAAVMVAAPDAVVAGRGQHVAVLKGTGHPMHLAARYGLSELAGSQGLSHTRMATESAVTAAGAHPFTVADDLCLVHNGSFSNHATIRRNLRAQGISFDSENDSEVAARFIAWRMSLGEDLPMALERLGTTFDGFYTLVVMTATSMAVVRDKIACKPAIIGETGAWVAMASEYRALAGLPGVAEARIFEPSPGVVYTWDLSEHHDLASV